MSEEGKWEERVYGWDVYQNTQDEQMRKVIFKMFTPMEMLEVVAGGVWGRDNASLERIWLDENVCSATWVIDIFSLLCLREKCTF